MTSEPYAFLSYSRKDSQTVDRLALAIGQFGVKLWRDLDDIEPGSNWVQAITVAMREASAILFVVSRNSTNSRFIMDKLAMMGRGDRLIPVLIDDTSIDSLPDFVRVNQIVLLRDDFQAGISKIAAALEARGLKLVCETPLQPHAHANKGYVFVSYAKEDIRYTAAVTEFFKTRGYAYFDYRDSRRRLEADFDAELEDRLQSAELVAAIVTPQWKKAVWPKKEYLFATKIGVPTYLLMFEDPGPSILIIDRTPIDFTVNRDTAFATLDEELKLLRL